MTDRLEPMKDLTLRELQTRHLDWLRKNFPLQVTGVTAEMVIEVLKGNAVGPLGQRSWQGLIADAINDRRLRSGQDDPLLGLMEEVGELSHAHLKGLQGIRGMDDPVECKRKKSDAVGDIVIYLASYCNSNDLDLYQCVEDAWREVEQRDWSTAPDTGVVECAHKNRTELGGCEFYCEDCGERVTDLSDVH